MGPGRKKSTGRKTDISMELDCRGIGFGIEFGI
jgi:hypothetical protein